jgi:hypothetical protein
VPSWSWQTRTSPTCRSDLGPAEALLTLVLPCHCPTRLRVPPSEFSINKPPLDGKRPEAHAHRLAPILSEATVPVDHSSTLALSCPRCAHGSVHIMVPMLATITTRVPVILSLTSTHNAIAGEWLPKRLPKRGRVTSSTVFQAALGRRVGSRPRSRAHRRINTSLTIPNVTRGTDGSPPQDYLHLAFFQPGDRQNLGFWRTWV